MLVEGEDEEWREEDRMARGRGLLIFLSWMRPFFLANNKVEIGKKVEDDVEDEVDIKKYKIIRIRRKVEATVEVEEANRNGGGGCQDGKMDLEGVYSWRGCIGKGEC